MFMPKKKTKKSAAKRMKLTATGKLTFTKPGRGHLLSVKSKKRKRHMRKDGLVSDGYLKRTRSLLV
jgi:large subunit ribosomal protein L35